MASSPEQQVGERLRPGKMKRHQLGHEEATWSPGHGAEQGPQIPWRSCQAQQEVEGREKGLAVTRPRCTVTAPCWDERTYCPLPQGAKTRAAATVPQLLSGSLMGSQASGLQASVPFIA